MTPTHETIGGVKVVVERNSSGNYFVLLFTTSATVVLGPQEFDALFTPIVPRTVETVMAEMMELQAELEELKQERLKA